MEDDRVMCEAPAAADEVWRQGARASESWPAARHQQRNGEAGGARPYARRPFASHPGSRAGLRAPPARPHCACDAHGRFRSHCTQPRRAHTPRPQDAAAAGPATNDDLFATDEFRMYAFKILPCARRTSHDWTTCPFAHPGEKARRRDPRLFSYLAVPCPDVKQNQPCPRGDSCQYAHSVFEYWLHPSRYRTQLCQNGANCRRTVCFFAHALPELRCSDPSHLAKTGSDVSAASEPAAPAAAGRGGGRRAAGGLERAASESAAGIEAHAQRAAAAASSGNLASQRAAASAAAPSSPPTRPAPHAHARAAAQQAAAAAAAAAAARLRRDSAPSQMLGAASPAASPAASAISAYEMYFAGGSLSNASRSISLPATPQLGRAQSLGAGGGGGYGRPGGACAAGGAAGAAAAAAWQAALDELLPPGGALPAPLAGGGPGWWPGGAGGGGGTASSPMPRGGGGGGGGGAAAAAAAAAYLFGGDAAAAAAFFDEAAAAEEQQAAAARSVAALYGAAAAGQFPQQQYSGPLGFCGDAWGGPPPRGGAAEAQLQARAGSLDAAAAAAGALGLDRASSGGSSCFALGAPGTPAAPRSPGLAALARGGSGFGGAPPPPGGGYPGRHSLDSLSLKLRDCGPLGGASAPGPPPRSSLELPPTPLQRGPSGSPPLRGSAAAGGGGGGGAQGSLGMLSPMAAPSRDLVVPPRAGLDSLEQHLARAGLGGAPAGAGAPLGAASPPGGGGPAQGQGQDERRLMGLVDELMQRLQQQ
ncbi:MAG: hypothetical protein J3K34DRAFT_461990 [Monoraphidium minutum]|nr:MAG: hypothetical protein J3K34DRAFT_461990 [Monoraphidium minutum]